MRYAYPPLFSMMLIAAGTAGVLNVPSPDYPTIQSAIDSAASSDTVLVQS